MNSAVRSPKSAAGRILVCFALKEEAGAFKKSVAGNDDASVLITGIGRRNAAAAVGERLQRETPKLVFTCGFAGGLNPTLAIGDVVFATGDASLKEKLTAAGAKPARVFCAGRVATTVAEKAELRRTTDADAVEMESEVIQELACARGIPCATVRAISDTAHDNLPFDFNQISNPDLSLGYGKLALAIAKSPGSIPALLRLQQNCRLAAVRLAEVLVKVIGPR